MLITDLIPKEEIIYAPPLEDTDIIYPTNNFADVTEKHALFLYCGVGKEKKQRIVLKDNINPYCIVTDGDVEISSDIPTVKVKNARRALSFAHMNINEIDTQRIKIIGVTGTNGKTTTANMIYCILKYAGYKCGFIGTGKIEIDGRALEDKFYSMTTPDPQKLYPTLKQMESEGCRYIVMEVSSHSLALEKISPLFFECGVFTNLSEEHLDFHKSMWEYYNTKAELFKRCKMAVINIDDNYGEDLFDSISYEKASVGVVYPSTVKAVQIKDKGLSGIEYFYKEKDLIFKVDISVSGIYNVYNSLMAAKCARLLGVKATVIKKALSAFNAPEGRMNIISHSPTVIIDYAHTPFAMENVFKSLNSSKDLGQKLITVFGCGGERDKYKRSKMGKIAEEYSDKIYITEDNSRGEAFEIILSHILKDIGSSQKMKVIKDRALAIRTAILEAQERDIIVLLGKGHEKYVIKDGEVTPFNEREIALGALEERKSDYENKARSCLELK